MEERVLQFRVGVLVAATVIIAIILFVMKLILGDLRVDEEAEDTGLDLSEHSEAAYGPMS